jgi:hypothetical protein
LEEIDMAAKNIQMDDIIAALNQAFTQSPMDKNTRAVVALAFGDNLRGCENFDSLVFFSSVVNLPSYNAD